MKRLMTDDERLLPMTAPLDPELFIYIDNAEGQSVLTMSERSIQDFYRDTKLHPANNRSFIPGTQKWSMLWSWLGTEPARASLAGTRLQPGVTSTPTLIKMAPPNVETAPLIHIIAAPPTLAPVAPPPLLGIPTVAKVGTVVPQPPKTVVPVSIATQALIEYAPAEREVMALLAHLSESELREVVALAEQLTPNDIYQLSLM